MRASYHVYLVSLLAAVAIIQDTQAMEYAIFNFAKNTPGGLVFETKLNKNAVRLMELATKHIRQIFSQSDSSDNGAQVKKINLIIDGINNDSTFELTNNQVGRICISADYIASSSSKEVGSDFWDLIYYELTHILLWTAEDRIPVALKDGIGAFIVLDVGTGKPRGVVKFGAGNSWDESSYVTGRFLQFCNNVLCPDFVPKLHKKMKASCSFDEKYFVELTRKTISEAWKAYKDKYN